MFTINTKVNRGPFFVGNLHVIGNLFHHGPVRAIYFPLRNNRIGRFQQNYNLFLFFGKDAGNLQFLTDHFRLPHHHFIILPFKGNNGTTGIRPSSVVFLFLGTTSYVITICRRDGNKHLRSTSVRYFVMRSERGTNHIGTGRPVNLYSTGHKLVRIIVTTPIFRV